MVRRLNLASRAAAWLPRTLIAAAIALLHLVLVQQLAERMVLRPGEADMPPRLQVVYLQQLELSDPPDAAVPEPVATTPFRLPPIADPITLLVPLPSSASSRPLSTAAQEVAQASPEGEADGSDGAADGAVAAHDAAPLALAAPAIDGASEAVAAATDDGAAEAAADIAAAAATPLQAVAEQPRAFEWPVSTRLSYRLDGNYRGEVNGSAQVEWINAAPHYQVNLDVTVGLPFAPLFTRHMRSDGRIAVNGLQPERYTEASQLAFRGAQRAGLRIDASGVRDARGRHWPLRGATSRFAVQDSASQFVQLSWLFATQPELLTPGYLIEFELALPRRLVRWVYEVGQPQTIHTPFGAVEAVHVHPHAGTERGSDLLAQAWFAPRLAHLPVRIRIEQSADVWLDLVLERRPELAAN